MVSTPVPSTTGAAGILSTGTGLPPGPPRKRAPDGSIVTSLLADKGVTPAKLSTSLAHARQRYAAKSLGGSASTAGAFASFTWDPGQDVTVSFVYASAVTPGAQVVPFGRINAGAFNVRADTDGTLRFYENTTERATSAAGVWRFDGLPHLISMRVTGTTVSITHDGVLSASGSFASVTWSSNTYYIGAHAASTAQRWPGAIWNVEGTDHGTAANGFTFLMDEPPTSASYVNTLSGSSVGNATKNTNTAFPWVCSVVSTDGRGMPWQSQGPLVYAAHRSGTGQVLDGSVATEYILTFNSEITDPTGSLNHSTGVWTAPAAGVVAPSVSFLLDTGGVSDSLAAGFYLAGTVTKNFLWTQPVTTELRNSWVDAITVAAGQTVDFRVYNIAVGNTTLESSYAILQLTFYPTPVAG